MDRVSCLILAIVFAVAAPLAPHDADAGERKGAATAPSFALPTATGSVSLDSLRGKVVLVDFWASWCVPCKSSFPWMSAMQQRYGPKGLTIVAINVDKSRRPADEFLRKHPAPFVVAYDPSGKTAKAFHVWGMPTSFLVGRDGAILVARSGFDPKHAKEMEGWIQEACSR